MCSIIGFKAGTPANHQENVEEYLKILEERGDQSFGYFYITPEGGIFFAKSLHLTPLLADIKRMPTGSWCFLHARKASLGMTGTTIVDKTARAHPVVSDDEKILLLHNGTKASIKDTVFGSISDSQGLATLLSLMWENRDILAGEIGVVIYERRGKIYLYKDGMRPLVMAEDKTIFASEPVIDTVKWQNIGLTTGKTSDVAFDIELDFTKEDLGLQLDEPIEIKFNIAVTTVKNFSVAGMPRVSLCNTCKKRHIDLLGNYNVCCVCAIERRKPVTYGHYVPEKKVVNQIESRVNLTPAVTIPTATVPAITTFKDRPKAPTKQVGVIVNKNGVVECGNITMPTVDEVEIFTSDINLLKAIGYDSVVWKGWAIVKTNLIYKNLEGVLFVEPMVNGHHRVKVDRVFVRKDNPIFKRAFSTITSKTVVMLGEIDNKSVSVLKGPVDISTGVRNVISGEYKLETYIMPKFYNGNIVPANGVLIGFRALES